MNTFGSLPWFDGVEALIADLAEIAKVKSETLRTDPEIFEVWTSFVVAAEKLVAFRPSPSPSEELTLADEQRIAYGLELIRGGRRIISHMTRSRVPTPKTVAGFVEQCERYRGAAPLSNQAHWVRSAFSASHP